MALQGLWAQVWPLQHLFTHLITTRKNKDSKFQALAVTRSCSKSWQESLQVGLAGSSVPSPLGGVGALQLVSDHHPPSPSLLPP